MKIDLSGKVAIVTGSTGGIGFAIAHGLAACGATVVINGRNRAAVDKAIADMRVGAPEAELRGVVADLATATGCGSLVGPSRHVTSSSTMSASMARRTSSTFPTANGPGFSSSM